MENRTTGTASVVQRVTSRHHAPMSVAEAERKRFVELAYRLVRCTEPEEQGRLKEELVRLVLNR
jgi:hypothetical protein